MWCDIVNTQYFNPHTTNSYNHLDDVNARKSLTWECFPSLPSIPYDVNVAQVQQFATDF